MAQHSFFQAATDFVFVRDEPAAADAVFVPGSGYAALAEKAAGLYREGYAPLLVISGRWAKGQTAFHGPAETEADFLAAAAMEQGVPPSALLLERHASYTWQNALFSAQLLHERKLEVHTGILCCKEWHARRALLYYQAALPLVRWLVCPCETPDCSRDNWWQSVHGRDLVFGELSRLGTQVRSTVEDRMNAHEG